MNVCFNNVLETITAHSATSAPSLPSLPVTLAQIVSSTGSAISQWTSNGSAGRVSPFSNSSVSLTASSAIPQRMIDSNIGAPFSSHSLALVPSAFSSHSAVFGSAPTASSSSTPISSEKEQTLSDDDEEITLAPNYNDNNNKQLAEYLEVLKTAAEISNPERRHSPTSVYIRYRTRKKQSGGRPYKTKPMFLKDLNTYKKNKDKNKDSLMNMFKLTRNSFKPQAKPSAPSVSSSSTPISSEKEQTLATDKTQLEEYVDALKTAAEISKSKRGHSIESVYKNYANKISISGDRPYKSLSSFKDDVSIYKQNKDKDKNFLTKLFKQKKTSRKPPSESQAIPRDPKDEKELAKYLEALETARRISKPKCGHNIKSVYKNYTNEISISGGRPYKSLSSFRNDVDIYKQKKDKDKNFLMKLFERKIAHSSVPQASLPAPSDHPAQEQETSAPLSRKRQKTSSPDSPVPPAIPPAILPAPIDPAQKQETSAPLSRKRQKTSSSISSAPQPILPAPSSDPAQEQESNSWSQVAPWESHLMPAESRQNMLHPFDLDLDSPASGLPDTLQVDEPHPFDLSLDSTEFDWNSSNNNPTDDISRFLN